MGAKPLSEWTDEEIRKQIQFFEKISGLDTSHGQMAEYVVPALREILRLRTGLQEIADMAAAGFSVSPLVKP